MRPTFPVRSHNMTSFISIISTIIDHLAQVRLGLSPNVRALVARCCSSLNHLAPMVHWGGDHWGTKIYTHVLQQGV